MTGAEPRDRRDFGYTAEPVGVASDLADVVVVLPGDKKWHLAGRGGAKREQDMAGRIKPGELPVFLGSGLGGGIEAALKAQQGPVAVVDKEAPILDVTGLREKYAGHPRVLWVDDPNPATALAVISKWQLENRGARLRPLVFPVYLRLDPDYYSSLNQRLTAGARFDFWAKARYPKFQAWPPRVLLISSKYFLMGEVVAACRRMNAPYLFLNLGGDETGRNEFVEQLLSAVIEFRPDFVMTINHLGVDREGVLTDLLSRLELPLASWFVDNPHLILYLYDRLVSPFTAIFTWDADNVDSLKDMGFKHVRYLPLATDVARFNPRAVQAADPAWRTDVSFVGNSMVYKVGARLKAGRFPRDLLVNYRDLAAGFGRSEERSVRAYLAKQRPDLVPAFESLDSLERKLAFEAMITWESTRQYRASCVEKILPFAPLIVGDEGWLITFKRRSEAWRRHHELSYYTDLPRFYPCSKVNFNCTSKQMKGAVNQRVFDVPACGAFLVTDHRRQMENLFIPGKEAVFYRDPDEIEDLVARYLKDEAARISVARAARRRILAEHTYDARMKTLFETMREIFG